MKVERISEKLQKTIPKLGGYIFDKYLSDILPTSVTIYDTDIGKKDIYPVKDLYKYKVEIMGKLSSSYDLTEDDIKRVIKIFHLFDDIILDKSNIGVHFGEYSMLIINLKFNKQEVQNIKDSEEYKKWLKNKFVEYNKYKEDVEFRKNVRKYNL